MKPLPRPHSLTPLRSLTRHLPRLLLALAVGAGAAAHAAPDQKPAAHKKSAAKKAPAKAAPKHAKGGKAAKGTKSARAGKAAKAAKAPVSIFARKVDYTGEQVNFGEWKAVNDFADEMAAKHGFDRAELRALISQVHFVESAVQLVKPAPPGQPKNWQAYRNLIVDAARIDGGVEFWTAHAGTLARAEAEYGVPAEIIVAIIGVETVYGRNTGRFRVMDTLTTLAFAYPEAPNRARRMEFFRGELENTLLLARKYKIDPLSLLGSFAGAVGMPQFMPGNILTLGVDFDGDGTVNLRDSPVDAIGSVANFLVKHGWQGERPGPVAYPATVSPNRAWEGFIGQGLEAKFSAQELAAAGVATEAALPAGMLFGLVDLQNGAEPTEYWLGNNNFFAITQYNRSYFYAMSVVELGRAVRLARVDQ